MTTSRLRRDDSEQGSILLAMVAVLAVSGLLALLMASTLREQRSSRVDRAFTTAVQGADAGVQQALFAANNGQALPTTSRAVPLAGAPNQAFWQAQVLRSDPDGRPLEYNVLSTSYVDGAKRTVAARLVQEPRFALAAFADSAVTLRGGNRAISYLNQTVNTGRGRVGSNGTVTYNGNATADGTDLYDYGTTTTGRCSGAPCGTATTHDERYDISSAEATAFMVQRLAACGTGPFPAFTASAAGFTLSPEPTRGYYCFSDVTFDGDTTINGSATNPVVIYMTGTLSFSNQADVNVRAGVLPESARLQIYSLGAQVRFGNHSRIGGAIWAPLAHCGGNPSNAQTKIYGSLICASISNQGGWNFFYDERLGSMGDGQWRLRSYSESVGAGAAVSPAP